jgi:hypothetical protein
VYKKIIIKCSNCKQEIVYETDMNKFEILQSSVKCGKCLKEEK